MTEAEAHFLALAESLPGVVWTAMPNGEIEFVDERWGKSRGRERATALGDGWLAGVHPDDRERTIALWHRSIATGDPYEAQFRVHMADGTYRWQLVRAQAARDAAGAITHWVGVNVDVDDHHRADEARDMFVSLADNSSDVIGISDLDGRMIYVNEAGRRHLGIGSADAARETTLDDYLRPEDRAEFRDVILPAVRRDGRWIGDFTFRNLESGAPLPVMFHLFALRNAAGMQTGFATVSRDLRRRRRVDAGLYLLSRTGAATLGSLELQAMLTNIAHAFVPEFASYCIMDIVSRDNTFLRVAVHRDEAKDEMLRNLARPTGRHHIARALDEGISSVVKIADGWLEEIDADAERRRVTTLLDVQSFIAVPVVAPSGEIVGVVSCVRDHAHAMGTFMDDDLPFVQEVGRRAGAAIANARLYERERRIALELQAAALPATLPFVDHLHLHAEYRPGSDEAKIGGDWYDAFVLEDGRVAITVGDVLGHGLPAAVAMAKLRQAMQSAAMVFPDPNLMLRVADRTLKLLDAEGYATAVAGIYDRDSHTLTIASAGHPGPIVRRPDGTIVDYQLSGLMLGLRDGDEIETLTIEVPPLSTIVFYTDGLTEATRDIAEGMRRLREAIADDAILTSERPGASIVAHVLGDVQASDDIAVLVAQTGPATDPPATPERQVTYAAAAMQPALPGGELEASSGNGPVL